MNDIDTFRNVCEQSLRNSLERVDQSAFPYGDGRSNPWNATPYLASIPLIKELLCFNPQRSELFDRFCYLLDTVKRDLTVDFAILGGSFCSTSVEHPNDIDVVLFYSKPRATSLLPAIQARAKRECIDIRLMPFDIDPVLVAKMIGYFVSLYGFGSGRAVDRRAIILDLHPSSVSATCGYIDVST